MKFLQFDSGVGVQSRMLIFSTEELLLALRETTTVFSDGTFKMAPTPFKQLYILRAEYDGVVVTSAYVLLTCKTQKQYNVMFTQIKTMCPGLDIGDLMIDFEPAVRFVVLSFCYFLLFVFADFKQAMTFYIRSVCFAFYILLLSLAF